MTISNTAFRERRGVSCCIAVDIEGQAESLGDLDIENFATLLINRGASVLCYGVILSYPKHLARLLEKFQELDVQQSLNYAHSHPVRRQW